MKGKRDKPETELVITPQMVEAGKGAIDQFYFELGSEGLHDPLGRFLSEVLARAVFEAMSAAQSH